MCERQSGAGAPAVVTRRGLLGGAAVAVGAVVLARPIRAAAPAPATVDLGGVAVVPRSEWGGDLVPTGPIPAEADVRYLLVHHSVDPGNGYGSADVPRILRGFVAFHQRGRGWPDLAYNFLVDRFGTVWEGRTGSLAGPVAGDATGGNQGFDQLCCFIGNHQSDEPTPEAFAAMGRLLGALAARYRIPLGSASATFVSRGSNRHPAGTTVTTPTIAGHRDMSRTQCPGDRVAGRLPELRLLAAGGSQAPAPVPTTTTTAPPPPTSSTTTTSPTTTSTTAAPATTVPPAPSTTTHVQQASDKGGDEGLGPASLVAAGALAVAGAAAGATAARRRRPKPDPTDH